MVWYVCVRFESLFHSSVGILERKKKKKKRKENVKWHGVYVCIDDVVVVVGYTTIVLKEEVQIVKYWCERMKWCV